MVNHVTHVSIIASVLNSAAWTYVAGAVSAIGTLLYVALVTLTRVRRGP